MRLVAFCVGYFLLMASIIAMAFITDTSARADAVDAPTVVSWDWDQASLVCSAEQDLEMLVNERLTRYLSLNYLRLDDEGRIAPVMVSMLDDY